MITLTKTATQTLEVLTKKGRKRVAKYTAEEFMDLVVERIGTDVMALGSHTTTALYSVAHYGKLNGDPMRDPDVVVMRVCNGDNVMYIPVSYRNDYLGLYQEATVFERKNLVLHNAKLARSISAFMTTWMRNIKAQGFIG